jgi:polyhydroxybutyrate depolymerase
MHRFLIAFLLLGFLAPAQPAPADEPRCLDVRGRLEGSLETTCRSLENGGRPRTYRIYLPERRPGRVPLLFVLHGGGGSGSSHELLTRGKFHRIADREGVIVVYPDGVERHWNDGRDLAETAFREQVDDVGFMRALVEAMAREHTIDRSRIYATGISNGGFMSVRLACDAADIFVAVAPVAAGLSSALGPKCRPSLPVSVALINGTEDPLVPWAGGTIRVLGAQRGTVWSTERTFEFFLAHDRCADRSVSAWPDADPADQTSVVLHEARGCLERTSVRLYEVRGGGHTWPRGAVYAREFLVGRVSRELDATEDIWRFFAQHPRSHR